MGPLYLILGLVTALAAATAPPCRFAPMYSAQSLVSDRAAREEFLNTVMYWEGQFHKPGVSYHPGNGHTMDGHSLNYHTGDLYGTPHDWSAPSKEALHIGMLALVLAGNQWAQRWTAAAQLTPEEYAAASPTLIANLAKKTSIDLLQRKIATYESFNRTYPGFGGYLPWVLVTDSGIRPTWDWADPARVPGLDNGELVWAMYAAQKQLEPIDAALAMRYRKYLGLLARTAVPIFYEGNGQVRTVTIVKDTQASPLNRNNYEQQRPCGEYCFLDDPYEGELLVLFMDLFSPWQEVGFPLSEREKLWQYKEKRGRLESVEFPSKAGPITVQRGFWFSAHEQWKFLQLPYRDDPRVARIFANCERARTRNAVEKGFPGLFASVNDVTDGNVPVPPYVSAAGIQEIASQKVLRTDIGTPYGAYPTILADLGVGLAWYRNMLAGSRMQGPFGSTESFLFNGTRICPLVTWDSKITTVLAMTEAPQPGTNTSISLPSITGEAMKQDGLYPRFRALVLNMYSPNVFPSIKGETLGFSLPAAETPSVLDDWKLTC